MFSPLSKRPVSSPARRSIGYTLVEMLVVICIIAIIMATLWPVLGRTLRGIRVHMGATRVLVGMQTNALLARENLRSDLDTSEPRVVGATYAGTALVFDGVNHKAWYTFNHQAAVDPKLSPVDPLKYIEMQDTASPAETNAVGVTLKRKAYQRFVGEDLEHVDLPESLVYYGVGWDAATKKLTLLAPPFAICSSASGNGLPPRQWIEVDLRDGIGYRHIPTSLPWVVVAPNTPSIGIDPANLEAMGTLTAGKPDMEKLQSLVKRGGGMLMSVAINGSAKI